MVQNLFIVAYAKNLSYDGTNFVNPAKEIVRYSRKRSHVRIA